ncbi:5-dehydro-4-deoxy-D-glucuronate isomerase [Hoeflea sp. WL0058]|uniref:4-deoxy-L-threo-5-hexosulose-uronate ketol-isomerase n=1 Tax=Flavimaribacter sediminis TaxID=2865987 RepID=A0AAE2ZRA3_9HYPH|nr:5-dehydro-4-deoxy-D-glucuronate isomerase [Flavimaribacter sediminis]MBW8640544.1 5-dehydro-4-deoxy-D-glucuronate isomerase [Flavimaribacter sediminis]
MTMPVRQAISPVEARGFDTQELRRNFLIESIFTPGRIGLTYSHLDRTIVGGAMPLAGEIVLATEKQVGSDPFLKRREMGVFNIGGAGEVVIDGEAMIAESTDCIYVPAGTGDVRFRSRSSDDPAKFYLVSTPAHTAHPVRRITAEDANRLDLGAQSDANRRILRQYIHPDICETCQLVMGMTVIEDGSVWNTMPCHTHDRRTEFYLYFDMASQTRVFHFMGEPDETRHLVVANEQAILSPGWSIHCGAGTGRYAFIWSMAGDNQDFNDMDFVAMEDLR